MAEGKYSNHPYVHTSNTERFFFFSTYDMISQRFNKLPYFQNRENAQNTNIWITLIRIYNNNEPWPQYRALNQCFLLRRSNSVNILD